MQSLPMKSHTSWNHTVIITTAVDASTDVGLWPLSSCGGIDGLGIPYYVAVLLLMLGCGPHQVVVELMA